MKQLGSPIAFCSNLYPLKQGNAYNIRADKDFLAQIRERKAIAVLHDEINRRAIAEWMYRPAEIQKKIYRNLVVTPYACLLYPKTQPWGVVFVDGKERVVCKCTRTDCKGYIYCKKSIVETKEKPVTDVLLDRMKDWYQAWTDLRYKIEAIRIRYNANAPLDENKINKLKKSVSEAGKTNSTFESWIQELRVLSEKEDNDAYNAKLLDCPKWLDELNKRKNTLKENHSELLKYKRIAEVGREFHQNWMTDWKELEKEANNHLENLPTERFVSDLADKTEQLRGLIESVKSSEKRHREKFEKHQMLEKTCSDFLRQIQELSGKLAENISAGKTLKPREESIKVDTDSSKVQKPAIEVENLQSDLPRNISSQQLFDSFKQVKQEEFIRLPIGAKTIVNAGPGRGKTHSLVERIIHLVKGENVDLEDITVLCFSRAATAEVLKRLQERCAGDEELEGKECQLGTIDSYCWWLTHSDDERSIYNKMDRSYDTGIRNAIEWLNHGDYEVNAKYIIVDEIQDINGIRSKFILALLRHMGEESGFALLGDFCQSIYDFQLNGDESELTSSRFFRELCQIRDVEKISFSHNYRSDAGSVLNQKLDALRAALINEEADNAALQIKNIEDSGVLAGDKLDSMVDSVIADNIEESGKTTGILVWENVAVMDIASRFFEHMFANDELCPLHIQRRKDNAYLAGWIGLFFQHYADDWIDKERFIDSFDSFFSEEAKRKLNMKLPTSCYWEALEQCMIDDDSYSKEKYLVENLLRNVSLKAWSFREKCGVLFSGFLPNSSIIISTVHQAKGREYDQVYISQNILDVSNNPSNEACRVAYVALSRTKGDVSFFYEESSLQRWHPRWHRIDESGRRYKKKDQRFNFRPAEVEFGLYGDVDGAGFAKEDIQQYIQEFLPIGIPLQLDKRIERLDGQAKIVYELVMDGGDLDAPDVLGRAGIAFVKDLEKTMPWGNTPSLEDYPRTISSLYVNDLITFIDKDMRQGEGLKKYGNLVIWNGLSMIGTGKCVYSY